MGAHGSQGSISIKEETVWGTPATGDFDYVNFVSEDLAFEIENEESATVRPDRQTSDVIPVGAACQGGLETEFQAKNLDALLPGFFWDTGWHFLNDTDGTGITAGASGSNLEIAVSAAGKTFTFGSAVTHAAVIGQHIVTTGFSNSPNNGLFKVTNVSGQVVTVDSDTLVDETAESTANMKGDYIRNGVTRTSFTIERGHHDVSQFFLYSGKVPNTIEFIFESKSKVMVNLGFIGKDEVLKQVTSAGTPTAAPDAPVFNTSASVGTVNIDGSAVEACLVESLTLTMDNQAEGKPALGTLGFCNVVGRSIKMEGEIALYFNDATYYNKYKNSSSFSVDIPLTDSLGNYYILHLPACKYNKATANISGKDDDVLVDGTFLGIIGSIGKMIQLTKVSV